MLVLPNDWNVDSKESEEHQSASGPDLLLLFDLSPSRHCYMSISQQFVWKQIYMSAWTNANLNCCGCKKKKKSLAFLTAVKENNKKCRSGSKKENLTDFFFFFLARSHISDVLKPQRQNKEWLKDHWGHIMWCTRANSTCTHGAV